MLTSARNKLKVKIVGIEEGAVNCVIKGSLGSQHLAAVITKDAVKELGLSTGDECFFIFKASNVMVAKSDLGCLKKISARNQLRTNVEAVEAGAVNSEVDLKLEGGENLCAIITKHSCEKLELKRGEEVIAIIKASEILVGI